MQERLSNYKFRKIATESLINGIRLHLDSILLFENQANPSALQLSIIAIEEVAKAQWVEQISKISKNITSDQQLNNHYNQWLKNLYSHTHKQTAFLKDNIFEYSPAFRDLVFGGKLEVMKQNATYVGLKRIKKGIDIKGRISIPRKTKKTDAKKLISILNDVLLEMYEIKVEQESYFDLAEMDNVLDEQLYQNLKKWKYKSGIKNTKWIKTP